MQHKEFMERLCKAIQLFSQDMHVGQDMHDDTPPCICGDNEIAKREVELGTWRINSNLILEIEAALKNHVILNK